MSDGLRIATPRQAVLRRRIRLLVAATITYNVVEAVVALVAGTVASSVALIETRTLGNDGSAAQVIRYQLGNHLGSSVLELDETGKTLTASASVW